LIRPAAPDKLSFDPAADFVPIPGTEKKFGAKYDPVLKKFYILSNPVLPMEFGRTTRQLTRTTGAMLSSKDLRHWDVEKIFLYTPNIDNGRWGEAFQYFIFDFDGDDLVLASRTSFVVGKYRPPRGHDSNLLTFHRIENFRQAKPEHFLVLDSEENRASRVEATQYADAPLGNFAQGTLFDGKSLRRPIGAAQAANGDVYIGEESGRVLRFDAFGNYLASVETSPVPLEPKRLKLNLPPDGERAWVRSGSGEWNEPMNWFYWGTPDTASELAVFGTAADDTATVRMNHETTIRGIRFRNAAKYAIEGEGRLILKADAQNAMLESLTGKHEIRVPVALECNAVFRAEKDAALDLAGGLDLRGKRLDVRGAGDVRIGRSFEMHGGVVSLDGSASLEFAPGCKTALDGVLRFQPAGNVSLTAVRTFRLLKGTDALQGKEFKGIELPPLEDGLKWDVSKLYSDGVVAVVLGVEVNPVVR
jgi:hypothetical protein